MSSPTRRWLWIVNAVAVLIGAWLLAGTVNAMVASRLSPVPDEGKGGSGRTTAAAHGASRPLDHYLDPIKRKNVFNHGEPVPDEMVASTGPVAAIDEGPADGCTLPVKVLSTVLAVRNPQLSVATLLDNSLSPPSVVALQVGERVADQAVLLSVGEDFDPETLAEVGTVEFLRDDGRREICRTGEEGTGRVTTVAANIPPPSAATGEGIKRLSDSNFEVSQAEIDAVMNGGLATMAQDVRIVPYFEGGVPKGFKLYSIKPGSLLSKIGLMNGDVIQKVNGYDISSPEKALQIYGLLKNEKNVSVDLTRNGQNKSISYSIR